jgi:hypothetical protein
MREHLRAMRPYAVPLVPTFGVTGGAVKCAVTLTFGLAAAGAELRDGRVWEPLRP